MLKDPEALASWQRNLGPHPYSWESYANVAPLILNIIGHMCLVWFPWLFLHILNRLWNRSIYGNGYIQSLSLILTENSSRWTSCCSGGVGAVWVPWFWFCFFKTLAFDLHRRSPLTCHRESSYGGSSCGSNSHLLGFITSRKWRGTDMPVTTCLIIHVW